MWSADFQHVRVFDRGSTGALCLGSCDRDRGFKGAFCSGYIAPECQQFALFGDFDRIELDTTDGQSHGRTFECEFLTIAEVADSCGHADVCGRILKQTNGQVREGV
jgi:hypothetical protein